VTVIADARTIALGVLVPVVVLGVAGVAGGVIWARWADPPARSEATPANVELLLGRQFSVDGGYATIGLVLGLVVGAGLGWMLRRTGWLVVVGVTVGGIAAAAISYGVGLLLGPAPEGDSERGELLSGGLAVHVPGVFLAWSVGGLLGLLLVAWLTDRTADRAAEPALPDLSRPR
jgi:hypothetical protein